MEEQIQIFIMPTFDSARESLGYEEYDDYNVDAVLHRQGYDGDVINIEDEEIFEIEEGFIGRITSEEDYYLLKSEKKLDKKEDFLIRDDLPEGRYRLSLLDHVIYSLNNDDDDEDDDYDYE